MSTRRTEWHIAEQDLADYLSGASAAVLAASVETHLLGCDTCRARLAHLEDDTDTEQAWQRLTDVIDQPSPTLLGRLPLGHRFARSSVATPAMVQAALLSVLLVGLVPLGTALLVGDAGLVTLLVLAPLAPVAAVAVAYREWTDPAGEISLATPSAGLRLVALRALLVSVAACRWPSSPCSPSTGGSRTCRCSWRPPGACPAWRWPRWCCWPEPRGWTRCTWRSP